MNACVVLCLTQYVNYGVELKNQTAFANKIFIPMRVIAALQYNMRIYTRRVTFTVEHCVVIRENLNNRYLHYTLHTYLSVYLPRKVIFHTRTHIRAQIYGVQSWRLDNKKKTSSFLMAFSSTPGIEMNATKIYRKTTFMDMFSYRTSPSR